MKQLFKVTRRKTEGEEPSNNLRRLRSRTIFSKSKCEVMKMRNSVFRSRVKGQALRRPITA